MKGCMCVDPVFLDPTVNSKPPNIAKAPGFHFPVSASLPDQRHGQPGPRLARSALQSFHALFARSIEFSFVSGALQHLGVH